MNASTEIQTPQKELAAAKTDLERVLNAIPDAIFETDAEGRVRWANVAMTRLVRLPLQDILGRPCAELLGCSLCSPPLPNHPQTAPTSFPAIPGCFIVTRTPVTAPDGEWRGHLCVLRDVTQLERFKATMEMVEHKYASMVHNAFEGIFQITPDGRLLTANPSTARIFGYPSVEVMLAEVRDITNQIYARPEDRAAVLNELRTTGAVQQKEILFRRRDGSHFHGLVSARLLRKPNGEEDRIEGIVTDISERKILETQMLQNQKLEAIGQLAAGIAHEINSPIQYVQGNLWYLRDACTAIDEWARTLPQPPEDVLGFLEEIPTVLTQMEDGINRIAHIVDSMRRFSHPGGEHQPTDINALIEHATTLTRNSWKYAAELTTDLDPSLPRVPCAPQEITQVLVNIIVNAAQAIAASPKKETPGHIHVMTRAVSNGVEILIEDNGPGMDEAVRQRIFEPFFTTKPVGEGTGQGLFIAQRIIAQGHNGELRCTSSPGKGARFTIFLPRPPEPEEDAAP
ncbi:MAG: domain S-box protein [Desulfomicrobiaceae bacterium]|jgi:PAS domain S-box-containing protein|nr:domain S-box protein [Desulfomicrobiaceae bacterium]MDI3492779.1 two-component system, NtrC family, sensor kinase [Desulfomicrobiaceae bacterium]MDK2873856.1 two-component system, NtrC family, sensor kinase [Desulfomicrobiaceae bacterium]